MNQLRCARCDDVIGVYEPVRVFLIDDTMLEGSRLTLGAELQQAGSIAFHYQCCRSVAEGPEEQHARQSRWPSEVAWTLVIASCRGDQP
jgi:hypothetical protein